MIITSKQNEKIKLVRSLIKDGKERKERALFTAEGVNILKDLDGSAGAKFLLIRESCEKELSYLGERLKCETYGVSDEIFNGLCDTVTPCGAVAVFDIPRVRKTEGDTIIMLCGIADPGNAGAILRTACAKGIDTAILYGEGCADVYSPKAVRASMGGIFRINVLSIDYDGLCGLKKNGYKLLSLDADGKNIYEYTCAGKKIIAVGSEAHGIPAEVKKLSDAILSIPMKGKMESLNAAVSASVALYLIEKN